MSQQAVVAVFKADATAFDGTIRGMNAGLARWEKGTMGAFGRVEKGMDSLLGYASKLRNLSYAFGAGIGAAQAAQFIDASTRIRNQMRGIGEDGDANFQKVYLAATRALAPVDTFAQSVVQMQKVVGDRQPFDVTIRQMETLSKLLAVGGKSTEERTSTILQFTQALQSGVLQGDELRSLRENAPVEFLRAIAAAAGGTLEDLKQFGAEGKLTTDVMTKALDSLARVADQKMGQVQLTFGDAVNVLRNGALVAADAFNSGSGLSATVTAGLERVGAALGDSREAMEVFGTAVQYVGIAMAATFGGQTLSNMTTGLASFYASFIKGKAAQTAFLTATGNMISAQQAVARATEAATAKQAAYTLAQTKANISAKSLAKAEQAVVAAERNLMIQREALTVATNEVTAAQARLALGARIAAGAGAALQAGWAFIGGWPGALLIAGTAALTFASNMRTAADVAQEATQSVASSKTAVSELTDVQDRLNMALQDAGDASDAAHRQIMSNTLSELGAKRALLQIENDRLAASEKEQQASMAQAQAKLASAQRFLKDMQDIHQSFVDTGAGQENILGSQKDVDDAAKAVAGLQTEVNNLQAQLALTGLQLRANNDALTASAALFAKIEAQQAMEKAASGAQALAGWLDSVSGKMTNIAGMNLSGPFAAAAEWARKLYGWTAATAQVAPAMSPLARYQKQGELNAGMTGRGIPAPTDAPVTHDSTGAVIDITPQPPGGGGGGGGGSSVNQDQQKALDFIREMMTAEEQRAAKLAEMVDLRTKLVATYGEESPLVAQLDDAMQRYQDDVNAASQAQAQFFDDLSTQIANAITDWTNLGDVVRHILASMVQSYGPDFFTALLTPGKQTGDSVGTTLGNILTGQNHSGGDFGNQNARSVSPLAFVGAPRFHNGLMPDEFTAILQKGETVLPKGYKASGGAISINMPIDLRGADPSMRGFVEGQIAQLKKELPGRVVQAVKSAQKSRSL